MSDNQLNDIIEKLAETDSRSKSNTHRINELYDELKEIRHLTTSVELLAKTQKDMIEEMKTLNDRIGSLEIIPSKKWDKYTTTIITIVLTASITMVITKLSEILSML